MTYKLLALDLDGTLLASDGSVRDSDRAAIARLRAAGVPVTIATGRLLSGSLEPAIRAGIDGPIACVDGSHIADVTSGAALFERTLSGEHARLLRDVLARDKLANFVFADDGIVHDEVGEPFSRYVRGWSPRLRRVAQALAHEHWLTPRGVFAVVAIGPAPNVEMIATALRAELDHVAYVLDFPVRRMPGARALVARATGATKGTAIEWLAAHHGCSPREVVVVGDWLNDLPMFEVAGRSFAMGQAPDVVRTAATDLLEADAITGGGVAEAIHRAWGI